jgi:uncharacterized protein YjbI with pentapeptide repeats
MADPAHLALLGSGVEGWNATRPDAPNLSGARLVEAELRGIDLHGADLRGADLRRANLREANLDNADLRSALMYRANLNRAHLSGANLAMADLERAFLSRCDLSGTNLAGASLVHGTISRCTVAGASFTGARVYGCSVWDLHGTPARQDSLVITPSGEAEVTVDNLKVAQFIYLLLDNEEIREVIDTVGQKGVLILGRFTDRTPVLAGLRTRLRELGFAPIVFDFERPTSKDLTETVKVLAGLAAFIVADLTAPRSTPHEAQAVIPDYMVPFVPIIEAGEKPYAMFNDLWLKHDWVMEPLEYASLDALLAKLGSAVVKPALELRGKLLERKAKRISTRSLNDYGAD